MLKRAIEEKIEEYLEGEDYKTFYMGTQTFRENYFEKIEKVLGNK